MINDREANIMNVLILKHEHKKNTVGWFSANPISKEASGSRSTDITRYPTNCINTRLTPRIVTFKQV